MKKYDGKVYSKNQNFTRAGVCCVSIYTFHEFVWDSVRFIRWFDFMLHRISAITTNAFFCNFLLQITHISRKIKSIFQYEIIVVFFPRM